MILAWLAGCGRDGRPAPVEAGAVIDLRRAPFAELRIPADSLAGADDPTERIPLSSEWLYAGRARGGGAEYTQAVPIKPRGLFFFRETPGVSMESPSGARVEYKMGGGEAEARWSYDRKRVRLFLPEGHPVPGDGYALVAPLALSREVHLHRRLSGEESDEEFVRAQVTQGIASHSGLLLPAPSTAAWDVDIPPAAELSFSAGLVPPEVVVSGPSDGAELVVRVTDGGSTTEVHRGALALADWPSRRVDLSKWSGRRVRVTFETLPGASTHADLAFVAAPSIASRQKDPRKVVFVFLDTLRVDHLSLYGYERDTSAAIDHLASDSAVFGEARSVAPWTLPSARSVLTGRYPDRWRGSRTLQGRLSEAGFATGFIAGNVYLTSNFEMDRDFDYHQEDGLFPTAEDTTDDALAWLGANDGRDVFLQVHYMSAHLPYNEPMAYRYQYAGAAPSELADGFELGDVRRAGAGQKPELQTYIRDRYDNNIRYATDQVRRLVDTLDPNDILVIYADHGEEFWDHKGYEHGHTLYDELLHVPLVIRGPGMPVGRFDDPVSLLDVTPTVLDLLGMPVSAVDGRSLAHVGAAALPPRTVAFGWPLYGMERWGVVEGPQKWTTSEGKEWLFDLTADPTEHDNLLGSKASDGRTEPYRAALDAALQRDVGAAFRFVNSAWKGPAKAPPLWVVCTTPGGFGAAWVGDDPLDNMHASADLVSAERARTRLADFGFTDHEVPDGASAVELCWQGGFNGPREVYARPAVLGDGATCSVYQSDAAGPVRTTVRSDPRRTTTNPGPLGRAQLGKHRAWTWTFGIAPAPNADTEALDGRDAEADAMLSQLGYVAKDVTDVRGQPCEPPAR